MPCISVCYFRFQRRKKSWQPKCLVELAKTPRETFSKTAQDPRFLPETITKTAVYGGYLCRKMGGTEAVVSQWSGEQLEMHENGRAAQQLFREQVRHHHSLPFFPLSQASVYGHNIPVCFWRNPQAGLHSDCSEGGCATTMFCPFPPFQGVCMVATAPSGKNGCAESPPDSRHWCSGSGTFGVQLAKESVSGFGQSLSWYLWEKATGRAAQQLLRELVCTQGVRL